MSSFGYGQGMSKAVWAWFIVATVSLFMSVALALSGIMFMNGSLHNIAELHSFASAGVFMALSIVSGVVASLLNS
jgi:hypothetical protein